MASKYSIEAVFKAVDKLTAPVSKMQNRIGRFARAGAAHMRRFGQATKRALSTVASLGKSVLKLGAISFASAATATTLFIREFSKIEDAEAAFTPLLGGAEKAKKAIKALNETAASTPFQFETLAGAAKQLLPVMKGDIENTVKTIRMLGDTAGGNAQNLDSITRGFTKAMLKGKVDLESLNMIAEAGVPIFDDLAAVMGMEVGEKFFKMISAGKVSTDALIKAFERMTNKGGIFFMGMEISSKTTSGLFSTLKDNISLTAATIGEQMAPHVHDLLKWLTSLAKRLKTWVEANKELIKAKLDVFVQKIKTGFNELVRVLQKMNQEKGIFDRLSDFVDTMKEGVEVVTKWLPLLVKLTAAFVGLKVIGAAVVSLKALAGLGVAFNPIIAGAVALTAAVTTLIVKLTDVNSKISELNRNYGPGRLGAALGRGAFAVKEGVANLFRSDEEKQAFASGKISPSVVTQAERVSREIKESKQSATVTINDTTGKASITESSMGGSLNLQRTAAFGGA